MTAENLMAKIFWAELVERSGGALPDTLPADAADFLRDHMRDHMRAYAQAGALMRQVADAILLGDTVQNLQRRMPAIDLDAQAALDRYVKEAVEKATAKLRHNIQEATDAAFIFGAMDNVADIDATLEEFANAVSGAIRAAIGGEE